MVVRLIVPRMQDGALVLCTCNAGLMRVNFMQRNVLKKNLISECRTSLFFACVWCDLIGQVYDAAPPPRKVGVANLPPTTGTGDTLWHGAKHYKVLRVSNHYK